jgi:hypothetical protein
MMVAFAALLAALGGSAVALPGKNKVDKNDIKKNAIGAKQIKTGAVGGSEAKNNSLKGADIDESSLDAVPNANRAASAATADTATTADTVAGQQIQRFNFRAGQGAPTETQTLQLGHGFRIELECTDAQSMNATAFATEAESLITSHSAQTYSGGSPDVQNFVYDENAAEDADGLPLTPDGESGDMGVTELTAPSGSVTVHWTADSISLLDGMGCTFTGYAVSG